MRQFLPRGLMIGALALTAGCSTGLSETSKVPTMGATQPAPLQQTSAVSPSTKSQLSMANAQAPVSSIPLESDEFSFPQDTCGDRFGGPNATWYPVFIDGGNLQAIQQNLCRDAISKIRNDTGVNTVQLASFADYEKAIRFADTVKGDVGQPSNLNASTSDTSIQSTAIYQAWVGVLVAQEPDARINVRRAPRGQSTATAYGLVGDRVTVTKQSQDGENYTWYRVSFAVSNAVGWVRSDFVQAETQPETTHTDSSTPSYIGGSTYPTTVSGNCQYASQRDVRGRRCGGRAASERLERSSGGGSFRSSPRRRRR